MCDLGILTLAAALLLIAAPCAHCESDFVAVMNDQYYYLSPVKAGAPMGGAGRASAIPNIENAATLGNGMERQKLPLSKHNTGYFQTKAELQQLQQAQQAQSQPEDISQVQLFMTSQLKPTIVDNDELIEAIEPMAVENEVPMEEDLSLSAESAPTVMGNAYDSSFVTRELHQKTVGQAHLVVPHEQLFAASQQGLKAVTKQALQRENAALAMTDESTRLPDASPAVNNTTNAVKKAFVAMEKAIVQAAPKPATIGRAPQQLFMQNRANILAENAMPSESRLDGQPTKYDNALNLTIVVKIGDNEVENKQINLANYRPEVEQTTVAANVPEAAQMTEAANAPTAEQLNVATNATEAEQMSVPEAEQMYMAGYVPEVEQMNAEYLYQMPVYEEFTAAELAVQDEAKNIAALPECSKGIAYLPHPADCHRFIKCNHGLTMEMECAKPLYWDGLRHMCVRSAINCFKYSHVPINAQKPTKNVKEEKRNDVKVSAAPIKSKAPVHAKETIAKFTFSKKPEGTENMMDALKEALKEFMPTAVVEPKHKHRKEKEEQKKPEQLPHNKFASAENYEISQVAPKSAKQEDAVKLLRF